MNRTKLEAQFMRTIRKVHIYLVHTHGVEPFWTSIPPASSEVGAIIMEKVVPRERWREMREEPYEVEMNANTIY